jgi:hypothetical protein
LEPPPLPDEVPVPLVPLLAPVDPALDPAEVDPVLAPAAGVAGGPPAVAVPCPAAGEPLPNAEKIEPSVLPRPSPGTAGELLTGTVVGVLAALAAEAEVSAAASFVALVAGPRWPGGAPPGSGTAALGAEGSVLLTPG